MKIQFPAQENDSKDVTYAGKGNSINTGDLDLISDILQPKRPARLQAWETHKESPIPFPAI